jgi:hypothetical protein
MQRLGGREVVNKQYLRPILGSSSCVCKSELGDIYDSPLTSCTVLYIFNYIR